MSNDSEPLIAVVTGGSRGVGRGVALGLGDIGATVYITGRSTDPAAPPGTIDETARAVTERGGKGVPVRTDHDDDDDVRALFDRVRAESGRLDVLVNNAFAIPRTKMFGVPFWEQPLSIWDTQHRVGLRSHYIASALAAPLMIESGGGLIANISSFGGAGFVLNVAYGVGKAGVDRLARDMAHELKPHGVTSVSLWPGVVRTEYILENKDALPFDLTVSESPELTGRAVAALARDDKVLEKTGKVLVVAELAAEYGFTDVDGTQPPSLRAARR